KPHMKICSYDCDLPYLYLLKNHVAYLSKMSNLREYLHLFCIAHPKMFQIFDSTRFLVCFLFENQLISKIKQPIYIINHVDGLFSFCLAASYSCGGKASTTIGAGELNCCVRDGNRCDLSAVATRPYAGKEMA